MAGFVIFSVVFMFFVSMAVLVLLIDSDYLYGKWNLLNNREFNENTNWTKEGF